MMCLPSLKTILIILAFGGLGSLIVFTAGPGVLTVPFLKIKKYLPTPHISVNFAYAHGASFAPAYDIEKDLKRVGYTVECGKIGPLSLDTCEQCMGSPASLNPHMAVLFKDHDNTVPELLYDNTNLSTAFHLKYDEALIILTDGPTAHTFLEFSWGVYIFDTWGSYARDLIQAGIGNPLRLKRDKRVMMIFTFIPELMEVLSENLQIPDVEIHMISLSAQLIQTQQAPLYTDRLAVLLKTLPSNTQKALEFYNTILADTRVYRVGINDPRTRALVRRGMGYDSYKGLSRENMRSEIQELSETLGKVEDSVKTQRSVVRSLTMLPLREIMGTLGPQDCKTKKINCLAEDWDLTYAVSADITLSYDYSVAIVGVDHPEGRRTTIGLFDAGRNQEIQTLPEFQREDLIYVHWLSRNCTGEFKPCTQVDLDGTFFIRERSYGVENYGGFVPPRVLLIKNQQSRL